MTLETEGVCELVVDKGENAYALVCQASNECRCWTLSSLIHKTKQMSRLTFSARQIGDFQI